MAEEDVAMTKEITVRIANGEMEAYVELSRPGEGEHYTVEEVLEALSRKNVKFGIASDVIADITEKDLFEREFCVAKGLPQQDGTDGRYDFQFDYELNQKPKMNEDGSVDYRSLHVVELVREGQEIAVYHKPTPGENGMSVTGKTQVARRGKMLMPLTGKGFSRSEDGEIYTSMMNGKIEKNGSKILISPVYEIKGDVDMHTGNIEFHGDVVVHGNVVAGMKIQATGSVTVDGVVEAAEIRAAKDILIRAGVIGGEKAFIQTKGNLIAQFMEFATVEVEGCIQADAILSCDVTCHDRIEMKGRRASIVGGSVFAVGGIEVMSLGNANETRTDIYVGVKREVMQRMLELQSLLFDAREMLERINHGLDVFQKEAEQSHTNMSQDPKRVALLRARVQQSAEIAAKSDELVHLEQLVERGKDACVKVFKDAYPGVTVAIGMSRAYVWEKIDCVEFQMMNNNAVMVSMRGAVLP